MHTSREDTGMKLMMELEARGYDIVIRRGSLQRASMLGNFARKVLVVSDTGVPEQYIKTIMQQCGEAYSIVVPQGEESKSITQFGAILSRLLELGFGRTDAVAAVGGGVVGDLAGFAAAAYMRGIDFFQFPTTTLAQIDSSIGGKVAIDFEGAKNIVGAFHQPKLVVVDPDTLQTLPERHWSNGLAEALKTGLIGSAPLFEMLEKEDVHQKIESILFESLLYKKGVVERDETEKGERMLLNFGHTIGHAIESASGFDRDNGGLLHGECVGLGMLPMIESRTLRKRTKAVMKKLNLPLQCPCTADEIIQNLSNDKKRRGNTYNIVKVSALGKGRIETVDFEELCLLAREAAE